jgi:hypothetical protein
MPLTHPRRTMVKWIVNVALVAGTPPRGNEAKYFLTSQ